MSRRKGDPANRYRPASGSRAEMSDNFSRLKLIGFEGPAELKPSETLHNEAF